MRLARRPRPHETTPLCGAMSKRTGKPCKASAGKGTPHPGEGRCRHHGGLSRTRHGRYSKIQRTSLGALIAAYEADPDPLNILPELAAVRALFQDYIERHQEPSDLADACRIVSEVTKIAERIERSRNANHVSLEDLNRVLVEFARVVETFVEDVAVRDRIRAAWLNIRVK